MRPQWGVFTGGEVQVARGVRGLWESYGGRSSGFWGGRGRKGPVLGIWGAGGVVMGVFVEFG